MLACDGAQCVVGGGLGAVGVAGQIAVAGQPHQDGAERERLVRGAQQFHRPLGLRDGLLVAVRVVQLPGVVVVQAGALAVGQPVGVAQRGLQERQRLAVRAGRRRLPPRRGTVGQDGRDVTGLDGVVDEPGEVAGIRRAQRLDRPQVQGAPAQRGEALLDGAAGELVAEREAVVADLQHALLLGLGQGVEPLAEQLPGQPELDGRGHDGQLLDRVAARRVEPADPGQHRVGDGGRHGDPRRGEGLGDVERVAPGQGM